VLSSGEVALYGSAFNFKRIINIELTEKGKDTTKKLVKSIGGGLDEHVSVLVGTFRDYFPVDAQVYVQRGPPRLSCTAFTRCPT
jgi:hypothetical protein